MIHRRTGAGSSKADPLQHMEWLEDARVSHSVLHAQTQSSLLDRAVGERVGVASRRHRWLCGVQRWKTAVMGEKPCLCHVYGDFSPKRRDIIRNKKTKLKKKYAISVSSAGRVELMKEMWVRALTWRKRVAGRLWGHRTRSRRVHKAGDMGRYIRVSRSRR